MKNFFMVLILTATIVFSYFYQKNNKPLDILNYPLQTDSKITTLSELTQDGEALLIYFGFLSCPEICPTTLATVASALKELTPEELKKVRFLFVDLDPERDSLEDITYYANFFSEHIIPVSIPLKDLEAFTKVFGVVFMKVDLDSKMDYTIDHSIDIITIDKNKKMQAPIHHGSPKVVIKNRIHELVK